MTEKESEEKALFQDVSRHLIVAFSIAFVIICGLFIFAGFAKISSAVVASGSIVVEGNIKRVQHKEGGIVKKIFVNEGDSVEAGASLICLDDTHAQANLAIITKQLLELRIQAARLLAERDGKAEISFPEASGNAYDKSELAEIQKSHSRLMASRQKSLQGRKNQLREQIKQLESQIDGLEVQRASKADEIRFIQEDINTFEILRKKDRVTKSSLNTLKREKAEIEGEFGEIVSNLGQAKQAVSEKRFAILQIEEDSQAQILEQYQEVHTKIAQLEEQEISARDQLKHVAIQSPQRGIVHQLAVHTVGAVITPGETVMMIVPYGDKLIVEAQVSPTQIDRLTPNQDARLKFTSFDHRTTPEINANLAVISADRITDQTTRQSYYLVRLSFDRKELKKLGDKTLIPGMPVEVYLQTGYRSILSYLVKPMMDQIEHAFKER
nr:HlyD family type I secretion periplasmic adaptor subunit [uncultured Cohaesibacter sp.]